MNKYKLLLDELNIRKSREEKILIGGSGVKTYDNYKYCLGRTQALQEIINLIEEYQKNDRI